MVSKITLFELHFDGAQFGPGSVKTADGHSDVGPTQTETEESSEAPTKSSRTKFLQGATVFVVMFVTLYTFLRRVLSGDEQHEE